MKTNIPPETMVLLLVTVLSLAVVLFIGYISRVILGIPAVLGILLFTMVALFIVYTDEDELPPGTRQ